MRKGQSADETGGRGMMWWQWLVRAGDSGVAAIMKICEGGRTAAALANLVALPAIDAEPVRHGKWINVCEMLPPSGQG